MNALPLRLLPRGGAPDPLAAAFAAQAVVTVTREAAIDAAMAAHTAALLASRQLPSAERLAARRAADAACVAAVDEAFASASRAAPPPPADVEPVRSAGEVRFQHQFKVRLPHHTEPVRACADLRVHLGVPTVDRITIFPAGAMFATLEPRSDAYRRALREIRGLDAGAIRRRAFELATADAELVEVVPTWFRQEPATALVDNAHPAAAFTASIEQVLASFDQRQAEQALTDLSSAIDCAEARL